MILVKFIKSYPASYMANMDVSRSVMRTLRRAGIPVNMSNGFNKHMNVYFTPPLPIAVESTAEYMGVDTPLSAEEFIKRYNDACHPSLRAVEGRDCTVNPNPSAKVYASLYRVGGLPRLVEIVDYIKESATFIVPSSKGEDRDVKDMILDAYIDGEYLMLLLRSGNTTLRVDRVLAKVTGEFGIPNRHDIVRLEQYTVEGVSLISIAK